MILLLPLCLVALIFQQRGRCEGWRGAVINGAVVWGLALVAITELFSPLGMLSSRNLAVVWTGLLLTTGYLLVRTRAGWTAPSWLDFRRIDPVGRAYCAALASIAVITLMIAIVAPPASWDAMTYHMARVANWVQNRSVAPYPTQNEQQLWMNPGVEFVLLHLQILGGGDRFAVPVEWAAFVGNIVVASLIAGQMGCHRVGQLFAALFAATIPNAIAQASGAQVQPVAGFWLGCFVSLGLRAVVRDGTPATMTFCLLLGSSLGLALLSKATAYLFAAPFLLWFFLSTIRRAKGRRRLRDALLMWSIVALVAVAVNACQFGRNQMLYGNPISPRHASGTVNSTFSARALVSNVVRNTALHFGTPSARVNDGAYSAITRLHVWLGFHVNDPRTTWPGTRFGPVRMSFAEENVGSPLHVLLFAATLLTLWAIPMHRKTPAAVYGLAVAGGFLLFCLFLRWQPWHTRLHVELLILAAAPVAYVLDRVVLRPVAHGLNALLVLAAVPSLLDNPVRPLVLHRPIYAIPRDERYFVEVPRLFASYSGAADFIAATTCQRIGLWIRSNDWEYPLWVLTRERSQQSVQFQHVQVNNASARFAHATGQSGFTPCAIVYISNWGGSSNFHVPPRFNLRWQRDSIRVFLPAL